MAIGNPISSTNNYRVVNFRATAGQTIFTIPDGYVMGKLSAYRNGVRLTTNVDYAASDAVTVVFTDACRLNDEVSFEILDSPSIPGTSTGSGAEVGIQSAGINIGSTKTLDFTGVGNTFEVKPNKIEISISGGARGGGDNKVFQENQRSVTYNYSLTPGYSAVSVGPVSVGSGVTVTIPGTERWVIL
jgi:hypothetical protein|tara:strand:+ start:27 stop:587 length:561 start_codon:yes stop_codon:yes gene_type:complete